MLVDLHQQLGEPRNGWSISRILIDWNFRIYWLMTYKQTIYSNFGSACKLHRNGWVWSSSVVFILLPSIEAGMVIFGHINLWITKSGAPMGSKTLEHFVHLSGAGPNLIGLEVECTNWKAQYVIGRGPNSFWTGFFLSTYPMWNPYYWNLLRL